MEGKHWFLSAAVIFVALWMHLPDKEVRDMDNSTAEFNSSLSLDISLEKVEDSTKDLLGLRGVELIQNKTFDYPHKEGGFNVPWPTWNTGGLFLLLGFVVLLMKLAQP